MELMSVAAAGRKSSAARVPPSLGFRRDRKSTRLNSSHRTTSYAVFCLKKKKRLDIALIEAAGRNDFPAVEHLLSQGADAKAMGGWALYGVAADGYTKMARLLLDRGANP